MNKLLLSLAFVSCMLISNVSFAQSYGCDGEFISAGIYQSLCEHPDGGLINLSGSASNNVIGFVWSDENGEIARDNLDVENYFLAETTTLTLSGIVISDNQILDGEFGFGDDFIDGIPSNYQGEFYTDYVQGPFQDFPPPPPPADGAQPDKGDVDYVSPLEEDGSYMITDDAYNGGYGFTNCTDPDGTGGNIAVFNLGAERNKVICTKVQLTAGNEYTFSVQVATVGEVTYQDFGNPTAGPPGPGDIANDPNGDFDGDGFANAQDCCPFAPSATFDDCDACLTPEGEEDSDGDGWPNDRDNCPFVPNPDQDPNVCSTEDRDGDGIPDFQDNCPEDSNPGQEDRDGDGVGDACSEDGGMGGGGLEGGAFGEYCIPYLEFEIQGANNQNTVIGDRHISELEFCVWTDMVRSFTATTTGEVEICLMSACPFAGGNLLALDNLQFSETCRFQDQVTIYVDNISANILPVAPLDCNNEGVLLEGEWDAIYEDINNIEFFWFESNQSVLIEGAINQEYYVEDPGTYNFSVLNSESGCYAVFPMEVEDNFSAPEAVIELPDTLSCINEFVILDASASSGGADDSSYTYEWNAVFGGEFTNGSAEPNSPIQEATGSGTYELLITNTFNGCTSETFIFVEENLQSVNLTTAQENFELGCDVRSVELSASTEIDIDTDPADIEYTWTLDSEIISTSATFEPSVVNESGVYVLSVVNSSSGCSDEITFTVTGEASGPDIIVPPVSENISCDNPTVDISASIDGNTNVSYSWTNEAGDNLSPNGELELSINEPGIYVFTAIDNISGCEAEERVEIVGNSEEPDFSIAIPSSFDCRTTDVMLEGLPSNQMGNYTYTWTDAMDQNLGDALQQTVSGAGTYTLQILDLDNGCSREVSINVFDVSAEPQVSLMQDQILNCANSSTTITLNSPEDNLTYQWAPGDGNITSESGNTITVDQTGNYSVIVTDEDTGCTTMSSLNLESNFTAPNFQASVPNNIDCDNATSTLFVDDFGANYTYSWTTINGSIVGGANTNSPTFDLQGDYILTVTNPISGCAVEQPFNVDGNSIEPEILISGGGQLGCNDQNLPINVSLVNMVPNISVAWSSNNGGAFDSQTDNTTALASAAGIYEVIVTNSDNGCTAFASISVTQDNDRPEINLPQPANLDCNNSSIVLDASGSDNGGSLQISWTAQNGSSIGNSNSLSPEITQPDTYTLTIINPDNGCETSASVTIEENNELPIVDLPTNLELSCDMPNATLGGGQSSSGSEFNYQWYDLNQNPIPGATNQTYQVSEAGTYELVITNSLTGCESDAQVSVSGNADLPQVDAGQSVQLDCNTESILLSGTASSNAQYSWTTDNGVILNGANTLQPEINAPGTYILTASVPSTGCEASASVIIEEDMNAPIIQLEDTETLNCINTEVVIDASQSSNSGVDILWTSVDNHPIENANSLLPQVSQAGEYILLITDQATGCENSVQVTIEENTEEPIVNLDEEVELDCAIPNMLIGQIGNPDYTYEWSSNITIQGSNLDAQIEVQEAGVYELLVTNNQSGCLSNYSVNVTGDFENTEILNLEAEAISCLNQSVSPIIDIDTDVSEVSVNWTAISGGNINSGANTLEPEFTMPGLYNVEITNLNSGCISNAEIQIEESIDEPTFDLGPSQTLNCVENITIIGISASEQNPLFDYTWTDNQGQLISNNPLLEIENSGMYTLEIVNSENGCSSIDQIQIEENIDAPEIDAVDNQTFRCGDEEILLAGSLLSGISNYEISWETENGRIVGGENTFEPTVTQPGVYTMLLTNLDNQCEASVSVTVMPDMDAPVALIDPAGDLTCDVMSIQLNGSNSTGNGNLSYTWFKDGIEVMTGVDQISVDSPGEYDLVVFDLDNNCSTTTTAFIELDTDEPEVEIISPEILDCENREVGLACTYAIGENYSFSWSSAGGGILSGANQANAIVDQPGSYLLLVEDLNTGCVYQESVIVDQDGDVPTFDLASSGELNCEFNAIDISATIPPGNFGLIWTNLDTGQELPNGSENVEITEPGTYQLEVIDQDNLCSDTRTIEVIENTLAPELDALQPLSISCENTSTQINAEILNDISNYNINWTTIDGQIENVDLNTLDLDVSSGGIYTLEVTNIESGCITSMDIVVPENGDTPSFEFEPVGIVTCDNPEVDIIIDGLISSANQSIIWSTNNGSIIGDDTGEQITVDSDGTYSIRVEDLDSGCFEEKSIEVEMDRDDPILSNNIPNELNCTVLEVNLEVLISNSSNTSIQWSSTNGNFVGSLDQANTMVDESGDYIVNVTNLDNGCSAELTIPVSQDVEIPTVDVDEASMLTCKEEVVSLQGYGPNNLNINALWSDTNGGIIGNAQNESVEVNLPGTYIFTITNTDNNCANSAEVIVLQNMDVPTDFTPVVSEPLCFGDLGSVNIISVDGGVGPYTYSIEGSDFDPTSDFDQLQPGTYNIAIMDSEECVYEENVIIPTTPELQVNTSPNVTILIGQSNEIIVDANIPESEIANVTWSPATYLSCDNCLNPTVIPQGDITYNVTIENENGCIATDSIVFRVQRIAGIYTPNAFSPNGDNINDSFTIYSKENIIERVSSLSVYDRWGNQVFNNEDFPINDEEFGWDGSYRNEPLQADVYMYKALVLLANGETEEIKGNVSLIK